MSKSKKNRSRSAQRTQKGKCPESRSAQNAPVCAPDENLRTENDAASESGAAETPTLELKTLIGTIDTDLYDQLLRPPFIACARDHDDEGLRQLVESVVTAVAARDAYDGCRKIDDICQRYLYYLESYLEAKRRTWELVEISALCDYWRSQVCMSFVRDAGTVFQLLLPGAECENDGTSVLPQREFLHGVDSVLNTTFGAADGIGRAKCACTSLRDFAHGISFPWLGFDADRLFSIRHVIPDGCLDNESPFALLDAPHVRIMADVSVDCLEERLLVDLIAAQHHKLYEELSQAFDDDMRLPAAFRAQLGLRVGFDRTYRAAFESVCAGRPLTAPLHRASRLDIADLNAYGALCSVLNRAKQLGRGVYLFHYCG